MLKKLFASKDAGVYMGLLFIYCQKFLKVFFDSVSLISSIINLHKCYRERQLSLKCCATLYN